MTGPSPDRPRRVVTLGVSPIGLGDVVSVARHRVDVTLGPDAIARLERGRRLLDRLAQSEQPVYGVTTGVGKLKDTVIPVMIAQYVAAALVSECKAWSHPASVDSIPTSGLQEDWNSMGAGAALKARQMLASVRQVLAIELLLSAQALDLRAPLTPGAGSRAAQAAVRRAIPHLDHDRVLQADLAAALDLVERGTVTAAVESAVGALA